MKKLKDMPYAELVAEILATIDSPVMVEGIEFATVLHDGQIRRDPVQGREDTPYIEHCLRNVVRLLRKGLRDLDILLATLLHDTVEDCATVFAPDLEEPEARIELRSEEAARYGEPVAVMVDGVTNPYEPPAERKAKSVEQKNTQYQTQIGVKIRKSVGICLVKLTDYIDNAGSLHHTAAHNLASAKRLAFKYNPLVPVFREVCREYALSYPDLIDWDSLDNDLERIGGRLETLVAA